MTGDQLGRYGLLGVLGRGAMGIVYEAHDPLLDRLVAIKTMQVAHLATDELRMHERRFETEARSAARLRHPNIVQVYDSGRDGDVAFLVMEKVTGVNLKQVLNRGIRFHRSGVVALMTQVLQGLAHAHQNRVVHRDIKPENVLLSLSGGVQITDFGIARLQDGPDHGTQVRGLAVGTPRYMAPEQVQGREVDARTDLFAAGVLLYELLTGSHPFDGDSPIAVVHAVIQSEPVPPSARVAGLVPVWDQLLAKALMKSPEMRFQSADAFLAALNAAWQVESDALGHSNGVELRTIEVSDAPPWSWIEPEFAPLMTTLLAPLRESHSAKDIRGKHAVSAPTQKVPADLTVSTPSEVQRMSRPWYRFWQPWLVLMVVSVVGLAWWVMDHQPRASIAVNQGAEAEPGPERFSRPSESSGAATGVSTQTPQPAPSSTPQNSSAEQLVERDDVWHRSTPDPSPPVPSAPVSQTDLPQSIPKQSVSGLKRSAASPLSEPSTQSLPAPQTGRLPTTGRCSALLEKASSGEPLSPAEQQEIRSSCR